MRAVRYHEFGGPEVLQYEDVPVPTPSAGQARVRVAASAFNAADNGMRSGFLPIPVGLPHVPGYDISGTVDALGEGADESGLHVGDAVIGFLPMEQDGGAAEYVVAPVDALTTGVPGRSSDAVSSGCRLVDTASRRDVGTTVV